ncbi:gluconate 2-dehydrogenase subunit 3 family protein [Bacteroidota bacterium]
MNKNRRDFLKTTGFTIGGMLMFPACRYEPAPFRFFTREEANCLITVCECIIPGDDMPGATEAGVIYYIDKQVSGFFRKHQKDYRIGLSALQSDCKDLHGKQFESLLPEEQTGFLELVEKNDTSLKSWEELNPSAFFRMVIAHTMQGFYGAPRHGGNKNYVSYRMLGIDYPQVIGQNRYRKGG